MSRGRSKTFDSFSTRDLVGEVHYLTHTDTRTGGSGDVSDCVPPAAGSPTRTTPNNGGDPYVDPESTLYDLFAVCNHYGRAGFGHYTAMTRDLKSEFPSSGSDHLAAKRDTNTARLPSPRLSHSTRGTSLMTTTYSRVQRAHGCCVCVVLS